MEDMHKIFCYNLKVIRNYIPNTIRPISIFIVRLQN